MAFVRSNLPCPHRNKISNLCNWRKNYVSLFDFVTETLNFPQYVFSFLI